MEKYLKREVRFEGSEAFLGWPDGRVGIGDVMIDAMPF